MSVKSTAVFICHCGGNISDEVDISRLKEEINRGGVEHVHDYPYLCSDEGQYLIRKAVAGGVDRVVIAACSPKVHEQTFRDCVEGAGLNRYMMDFANLREQCAWVGEEHCTDRAIDLVRGSVLAVQHAVPLQSYRFTPVNDVAIIGGGIAGITAARNLAKMGMRSFLIEEAPTIGGNMVKVGKVISPEKLSEDCAMCSLSPLMSELSRNGKVDIRANTRVVGVEGKAGDFLLHLESGPLLVDPKQCRSCGRCEEVCPVEVPDEWNERLSMRKAVYRPFQQSVPASYTIDPNACTKCGACVKACSFHAIDLNRGVVKSEVSAGAVIVATGHTEMDPSERHEHGYAVHPEVITQMELARVLAVNGPTKGRLEMNGRTPKHIVMVQCVGSRSDKPGSIPYCSKVCCIVAMKHASYIRQHFPGTEVTICYTDMRTSGPYETYYQEAQKRGVRFLRGRVGETVKKKDRVYVRVEDTLAMKATALEADLVVLSTAIVPSEGTKRIADVLGISTTPEMFIREKHPKLEPGVTSVQGILVCGTAAGAKDITESIMQAQSTAMNALGMVLEEAEVEPNYAVIDRARCDNCGKCVNVCGQNAIYMDEGVSIDPLACAGLGRCVSACPQNAISILGAGDDMLLARIDGVLGQKGKILAFLDNEIGYVAADSAGTNRLSYPNEVRIIAVPSVLRLERKHLIHAFRRGATGVFLGDGSAHSSSGASKETLAEHVAVLRMEVEAAGIDPRRVFFYEAYLPHFKGLAARLTSFQEQLAAMERKE
ncbi:MAG: CoB--CoM heterodisulfide reductase iron-sulfur subunit A [Methanomassiliicoccales archaeon PtaU1.Bin124]|nr:MAG: CoB--CoM heterodisulfide reductase iron-sulfur subunit A [Methanomassiliicoccales archaeon PtaU1.Bin124]